MTNNSIMTNSTVTIKGVSAVVFCLFSFIFLYFYQADIIAVAQHVLSGGVTSYNRTVGAVLITGVLMLLQIGISSILRLPVIFHSATYFPPLMILAFITSVSTDICKGFSWGIWPWLSAVLLVLWLAAVYAMSSVKPGNVQSSVMALFSRQMWVNMISMSVMFIVTGLVGNGNPVFHYRARMERRFIEKDMDGALQAGIKSLETNASLTMLRVYALACNNELGDKLFTYPVAGSSADLVPMKGNNVEFMMYPTDSLYRFLGAVPYYPSGSANAYLRSLINCGKATKAVRDYILCGYLIDRDIDSFAKSLIRFYPVDSMLPKHYREALILYTHMRSNPVIVYHDNVMDTDYEDMQRLEKLYDGDEKARTHALFEQYYGTYWWYYNNKREMM